tara:strand:- start:1537 stop:1788 length:252 start_codon:yes stop_codon:yes gene_type:complete
MKHQEKIAEGEIIKNISSVSNVGVDYALKNTKDIYINHAKKNKSFELHKWQSKDRKNLFKEAIRHYLNYADKQAEDGVEIGSN